MKLLRISAKNFKNCSDDYTIDFVAKARKSAEDKLYELQEIDDGLFTYNTVAFVGKNASGKTTALELIEYCYSILENFYVEDLNGVLDDVYIEIYFYEEGSVYKYTALLKNGEGNSSKVNFADQHIYQKKYYKSGINSLYENFSEITDLTELPEDTSIVFFVLKKKKTYSIYFDCSDHYEMTLKYLFKSFLNDKIPTDIFRNILVLFDENIEDLSMTEDNNYKLIYKKKEMKFSYKDLMLFLSSGTKKGMLLYTFMVLSLMNGFDLIVDEIENHFHKTLIENMISLYKDKLVNKNNASLIFSTHYCEMLDQFGRQDNIWISKSDGEISLYNMYEDYNVRSGLLKSRQFYDNTFKTAVNYDRLMDLKRELLK